MNRVGSIFNQRQTPALIFCLLSYGAYEARDLIFAWKHSPFDALGWLAFAIWLTPLFAIRQKAIWQAGWVAVGLSLLLAGQIGELNALKYGGLAAILAGLEPWRRGRFFWLISALAWMPAFGYVASHGFSGGVPLLRLLLATFGTLTLFRMNQTSFEQELAL